MSECFSKGGAFGFQSVIYDRCNCASIFHLDYYLYIMSKNAGKS